MHVLHRALGALGFKPPERESEKRPDYALLMREALSRIRLAELQIQEATSLEELDIGRSSLVAAQAEVQQLIRSAKRERGIAVRPIAQNEEEYRNLIDFINHRSSSPDRSSRRKNGTGR